MGSSTGRCLPTLTAADIVLAAVRALSEGRAEKRILRTIPLREFRATPAPTQKSGGEPLTPAEIEKAKRALQRFQARGRITLAPVVVPPPITSGRRLVDAFNDFMDTKPDRFTARQLFELLPEFDFVPSGLSVVAQLCRQMVIGGVLDIVDGLGIAGDPYVYAPVTMARGGTPPISAPEKETGTHTSAQPESIPARPISETEVQHGAAPRGQSRLNQTIPTIGPAAPEDCGRSVSICASRTGTNEAS